MKNKSKEKIPPGLIYIADNIKQKQNVSGVSKEKGSTWAKDLNLPKSAETVFFAGCGYQYMAGLESLMSLIRKLDNSLLGTSLPMNMASITKKSGIDITNIYNKVTVTDADSKSQPLKDAINVLHQIGCEFGYLGEDEPCCGGLLYYAGLEDDFVENAKNLYKKLKSFGIKKIISIVPSCTYTLKVLIPKYIDGFDIEVKHFSEVVKEGIQDKLLKFNKQTKVTYHDPCQLARFLGIIDEPRQILKAINNIDLIETEWTNKQWATCCGGGGGFEAVFPELSEILATKRAKELVDTGAEIIVTHCPGCIMQLEAGLAKLKNNKVQVADLAHIVSIAMEK